MIETRLHELPHGITLSCRSAGTPGQPVLMFLHGLPEAAFVWDGLLSHFSRPENGGFRCIAPNLRGYENSSAPGDVAAYRPKHLMQDVAALIAQEGGPLACLVAHDWGGAVAWNLAASAPGCMNKLAIINSPHPGTFLRELQHSSAQQASSAYMNFLIRPDAEALLAEDDFRRLWEFFTAMGAADGPHAWLTDAVKAQYRDIWRAGLAGPLNYYRASPLRPPRAGPPHNDPAAAGVVIPREKLEVHVPTLVIWAMDDLALPACNLEGMDKLVANLTLEPVHGCGHFVPWEAPDKVNTALDAFLG